MNTSSSSVGMSKVIFGLYIGNYRDSKDLSQMNQNGITHIIAIHDTARRHFSNKEYLLIPASDDPSTNLTQYFQECNDFIHRARLSGGKVLIHCLAGMSRSVTVAVAYIMSVTNLGMHEAIRAVRGARPVANPNEGFQRQLQDFEFIRLKDERRRMSVKFGVGGRSKAPEDESQCLSLVLMQRQLSKDLYRCFGQCATPSRCPSGMCRAKWSFFRRRASSTKINSGKNDSERHLKFYKQTTSLQRLPGVIAKKRIEDTGPETYAQSKHTIISPEKIRFKRSTTIPFIPFTPSASPPITRSISLPSSLYYTKISEIATATSLHDIAQKGNLFLSFPRALHEATDDFDTDDGINQIMTGKSEEEKKSLTSAWAINISHSSNSVIRITKCFKSLWNNK